MNTISIDTPKILLVDHSLDDLILLKTILEPIVFNFYIATNGIDALKSIDENDFDIILMDVEIPGVNGYEVSRKIKNNIKKCDIPVILLSSFSTYEDKVKISKSGADDYLLRPFSGNEIVSRIRLHLQKYMALKHMKELLKHSYHELYNPLAVIKSSVEMFNIYNKPSKYVNSIHAAAKTLHVIYDDLYYSLSSSHSGEGKKNVDLSEFITNRIEYFDLLAKIKGIEFIANLDSNLSTYITDIDLQRILDNTLSNAIKYAFEDTKITISLTYTDKIELSISNKGNNIELPERIFTDAYRENYEEIGMGIGLEIVASICNKNKIKIIVLSKENNTTFTYIFPRSEDENNTIRG